jgi:hypothetical protein
MFKSNKSKPIIIGKELVEKEDSNSSESDDSDNELYVTSKDEEVQGNFVFLKNQKNNRKRSVLKPESYIEE